MENTASIKGLEERLREMDLPNNGRQDALSVIYGFRPVSTVALWPDSLKPLVPQVGKLAGIAHEAGCSIKEGWSDLGNIYFFMKPDYEGKADQFRQEYISPVESDAGQSALGLLLGYPDCCVENHVAGEKTYSGKGAELIPFAPCSYECAKPWVEFYGKLG